MATFVRRVGAVFVGIAFLQACSTGKVSPPPGDGPTIVSSSIADGATGIPRDVSITVQFSEALAENSLAGAVRLVHVSSASETDTTLSYDANESTVTVQPTALLANFADYELELTTAIKSATGAALSEATIAFRSADDVAPGTPLAPDDDGDYGRDQVTFSWLAVSDDGSGVVSYVLQVATSTTDDAVVFDEDVGDVLSYVVDATHGQTLYARVAAVDAAGNQGDWSAWSVGIIIDVVPPSISSITPAAAAQDVAHQVDIILTATEPLAAASVTDATVLLYESATNTPITHTRLHDGATITLTAALSNYRHYTVELTTGVTDVSGLGLVSAFTSSFQSADLLPPDNVFAPTPVLVNNRAGPNVQFVWSAASDADTAIGGYIIQYRVGEAGTPEQEVALGNVLTHTRTANATTGQVVYARLAAADVSNNVSDFTEWSPGATVDATAPTVPSGFSDAGAFTGADVTFTWGASADVGGAGLAGYIVQVWTTPNNTGTLLQEEVVAAPATTFVFDGSDHDGLTLFARIASRDAVGNQSIWSSFTNGVTVDLLPPTAPGVPSAGAVYWNTTSDGPVLFSWDAAFDANGILRYDVHVVVDGGTAQTTTSTTNSYTRTGLNDGQSVSIRVRAVDNAGTSGPWSGWSDAVIVDNGFPSAPTSFAVSPDREYVGLSVEQVAYAFSAPLTGTAASYQLRVGSSVEGEQFLAATTVASPHMLVFASLDPVPADGATLYAQVRAISPAEHAGPWTETIAITRDLVAPTTPGTPSHAYDGQAGGSLLFDWDVSTDAVSGVVGYEIAVEANGTEEPDLLEVLGPPWNFNATAYHGQSVAVRVRAKDAADNTSEWSGWSSAVVVDAQPPEVSGATPTGDQVVGIAAEMHVWFDKPMDAASLLRPGAFELLQTGSGVPVRCLLYHLTENGQKLVAIPDPSEPQATVDGSNHATGLTNSDVLAGGTSYTLHLKGEDGEGEPLATDLLGNPLVNFSRTFMTVSTEEAQLISVHSGVHDLLAGPVAAQALGQNETLEFVFDRPVSAQGGRVELQSASGGQFRAAIDSLYIENISPELDGGNPVVRYTYHREYWQEPIADGQHVKIAETYEDCAEWPCPPSCFDGEGAATLVGEDAFTLPIDCSGKMGHGGHVSYASPQGSIAWTGPETLEVNLYSDLAVGPGEEIELRVGDIRQSGGGGSNDIRKLIQTQGHSDDTTAPQLENARLVGPPRFPEIFLSFSEAIDVSTIDTITLSGAGVSGADFERSYSLNGPRHTVLFVAKRALPEASTPITITVPATVQDLAGNAFVETSEVVTSPGGATPDARQVIATTPLHNQNIQSLWRFEAEVGGYIAVGAQAYPLGEGVDAASINMDDVLVVDDNGWVSRGWQVSARDGVIQMHAPAHEAALPLHQAMHDIVHAYAVADRFRFETATPHGLIGGEEVSAWASAGGGEQFGHPGHSLVVNVMDNFVFEVEALGVSAGNPLGEEVSGSLTYMLPTRYTISVGDGDGILDLYGRPIVPHAWSVTMQPDWAAAEPYLHSLADLRLGVQTAASGDRSTSARALRLSFGVSRPNDLDPSTYEVADTSSATVLLSGVLDNDWVSLSGAQADKGLNIPENMTATLYPASDYYPFTIKVAAGSTTYFEYTRLAWVWAAADTPKVESILDGSDTLLASPTAPMLVTQTNLPTLTWSRGTAAADMQALWVAEVGAMLQDGPPNGYFLVEPLAGDETTFQIPAGKPLEAGIHLWVIDALRDTRLGNGEGAAVSMWWPELMQSLFIYGPNNRDLTMAPGGTEYGIAQTRVPAAGDELGNAHGIASFDNSSDTAFQLALMSDNGTPFTGEALFGYDAQSGRFKTLTLPDGNGAPGVSSGWLGRAGDLLMLTDPSRPALLVLGTRRVNHTMSDLPADTWVVALWESNGHDSIPESLYGTFTKSLSSPGSLDINIIDHVALGESADAFLEYAVTDSVITIFDPDPPNNPMLSGRIGGSAGQEMAALTLVEPRDSAFILFMAKAYDLSGVATCSALAGSYRLAGVRSSSDPGFLAIDTTEGMLNINAAGEVTFEVSVGGQRHVGEQVCHLEHSLDLGRTILVLSDGGDATSRLELQAGPDGNTFVGIRVGDASRHEMVLLTKL